ncbi:MAG: SCO6745 family protein [Actinomycetota bacterium]
MGEHVSRRMWRVTEPFHAVVYFAPEPRAAYDVAGLKGGWMGYFASRSAAMGPVPPEVVVATFYNFHPDMVRRAIPDAWSFATPTAVLEARQDGVDAALRRVLGALSDGDDVLEAAELARRATAACSAPGRPLYAGHSHLPWPTTPHLELWHACTLLREWRGDGHVTALSIAGLNGCEANVALAALGMVPRSSLEKFRGWSDDDLDAATRRLQARGWLDPKGRLTKEGGTAHALLEQRTDELAVAPWRHLGDNGCARLHELMTTVLRPVLEFGLITYPNPIGVPRPD